MDSDLSLNEISQKNSTPQALSRETTIDLVSISPSIIYSISPRESSTIVLSVRTISILTL
jgi:hypothetical protein